MTTVSALVKALVTSLGDPKAPLKVLLSDLWDKVLPEKDSREIMVESLYEALQDEAGTTTPVSTAR